MSSHGEAPVGARSSRVDLALGLSALAVVVYVIASIVAADDSNGWMWPLAGVLGAAGAVLGWQAGAPRPHGKALVAVVVGGLVFLSIAGWIVWAAATGNF